MTALLLCLVIVSGYGAVQTELTSRLHLRAGALDSAAVSWLQTRVGVAFSPLDAGNISSRLGIELRADGFPTLASLGQLDAPQAFEPVSVMLGEAYVRLHDPLPGLSVTAGRQLVRWGSADAIAPTDNLVTPDYSDPLAWDVRRPVWMAHAEYVPSRAFGLEVAAKPVFEPAMAVPSRWFSVRILPTEAELRDGLVLRLIEMGVAPDTARMMAATYAISASEKLTLPANRLKDMTAGVRVKTGFAMFDVSASAARAYDFLPTARAETKLDPEARTLDFMLNSRYLRKTTLGGDISTSVLDAGLWAEAAYEMYDDEAGEDGLSVVVGADYSLAGFYANLQYLHGRFPLALAGEKPAKDFLLGALERKFLSDRILLRVGGVVDIKKRSFGLLPLVRWMPVPGLELDLGGMVFNGGPGSAFASLAGVDEVFFGFRLRQ